jgi:hypothetical protein
MPKAKTNAAKLPAVKTIASETAAKTPVLAKSNASTKPLAKSAVTARVRKPTKPAAAPKPTKLAKLRQKPVRDSFTMPETDFALIAMLKARALAARRETKKSELLRAGLHVLTALDTPALLATLGKLDQVKVGRPKKDH